MQILALGNEALRTGAPILLVEFLEWVCRDQGIGVRCILASSGPLLEQYQQSFETFVADPPVYPSLTRRVANKLGVRKSSDAQLKTWLQGGPEPDVIYVNTIAAIPLLRMVRKVFPTTPFVIHVHELTSLLHDYQRGLNIAQDLHAARTIIVVSRAVHTAVKREFGIADNKVNLVYEYFCPAHGDTPTHRPDRAAFRTRLGINDDRLLCLSMGTQDWRKAPETIPLIARACQKAGRDIEFLWLGRETPGRKIFQHMLDAERAGVAERVRYEGEVNDPTPYLSAADVFVLTSREDPYPLAMLEAAFYALPVLCFDGSGGAPEFVSHGGGIAVPYLDTNAMAQAILELDADRERLRAIGRAGAESVQSHHRLEQAGASILDILRRAASPAKQLANGI